MGSVTECRRGRVQRGEAGAAVEKLEDKRQPETFFGHRKRAICQSGAGDGNLLSRTQPSRRADRSSLPLVARDGALPFCRLAASATGGASAANPGRLLPNPASLRSRRLEFVSIPIVCDEKGNDPQGGHSLFWASRPKSRNGKNG